MQIGKRRGVVILGVAGKLAPGPRDAKVHSTLIMEIFFSTDQEGQGEAGLVCIHKQKMGNYLKTPFRTILWSGHYNLVAS